MKRIIISLAFLVMIIAAFSFALVLKNGKKADTNRALIDRNAKQIQQLATPSATLAPQLPTAGGTRGNSVRQAEPVITQPQGSTVTQGGQGGSTSQTVIINPTPKPEATAVPTQKPSGGITIPLPTIKLPINLLQ